MKLATLLFAVAISAHGDHVVNPSTVKPKGVEWDDWHMATEHNLEKWDADQFFAAHDVDNKGFWNKQDILYIYGLNKEVIGDGSGMGEHDHSHERISDDEKTRVVNTILQLMDKSHDGTVSADEWRDFVNQGSHLPDFNYGQGHHKDFEEEYEEHHWREYHANDDPDVEIKHKEDIEHELLHHQHEIEQSHDEDPSVRDRTRNYLSPIRMENLADKYKRNKE
ncbi:hypothetical protein DICA3_C07866 [Diutina catenulata]